MEIIAFVAGVNNYAEYPLLPSSQADAENMVGLFQSLQYKVYPSIDDTYEIAQKKFYAFIDDLRRNDYDGAIFYFSGHGSQVVCDDCLLFKDSPLERGLAGGDLKMKSMQVKDVVSEMHVKMDNHFDIIILDCCRDGKGAGQSDLMIKQIPFQTLFAYATTSGDKARTNLKTNQGYFTEAFLKHFDSEQDIETIFKKVRSDVYIGCNKLSWVHTCLVDEIKLTPGKEACFFDKLYTHDSYFDKEYKGSTADINHAIELMRVRNYYHQNDGIKLFKANKKTSTKEDQFVYGRNLWQAAVGDCYLAKNEITIAALKAYSAGDQNHVLNGILYEVYFNSGNSIRRRLKGLSLLKILVPIISDKTFEVSRDFIRKELNYFDAPINFRIDKPVVQTVVLNLKDTYTEDVIGQHVYQLTSLMYNNKDILSEILWLFGSMNKSELKAELSDLLQIPREYINIAGTKIGDADVIIK